LRDHPNGKSAKPKHPEVGDKIMPVVSDFIMIGESNRQVSIGNSGDNLNGWTSPEFNTGGRHASGTAYISFMVAGMTQATKNARILLNNDSNEIGWVLRNNGGNSQHWQTQTIS
jgi:hypothetical protein